nr:uncharacterized mitochondrial protein AtMg00810-like [Tanacetum cinerariifolium]
TLTVESPIPTVSSPVPTACLNDSPEPSREARIISKRVANQEETPSLDNILSLINRFENIIGVESSLDEAIGVEADVSNMETSITASPTPTLRIHKDHPKSQIIGPVDTLIQTRLFLAYASFMGFIVYQMDVKGAILYGTIDEEVEFEALMHKKFQMSAMGELNFFLGLQVLQKEDGIFLSHDNNMFVVCACARHQVTHKECHLHAVKRIFQYLKGHPKLGLWYPKESPFDLVAYSDSDYGGATQDRKSTTEGSQFFRIETTEEGTHILATVDGIQRTIFESSLRRNLKLRDKDGIVSLPDMELFKNLTLMGLSFSRRIVPLFDIMLVHQGKGSGTPTEPHHTPSPKADPSYHTTSSMPLPSIPTAPISPVTQTETTPIRQYTKRARISQSSALPTVADEPASHVRDVSKGEACPTDSGFIADQDRATIANSSSLPHDSAPRVTS